MIYFDYCANTPASKEVLDTFCRTEQECIGNANSDHSAGRQSAEMIAEATKRIADLIHVKPENIIYTSGATEANNLAIKGIAESARHVGKHIISTAFEHTSASASLTALQMRGYEIDLCRMGEDGKIDLEELEDLLRDDTCLVSMSVVDSEVGIIQPIKEVAELLKSYPQCKFHLDATQAVGKIPVDFSIADTVSFAPHKFYGLNGIGVLVKKEDVHLTPQISGGKSTSIYRSGTPATGMIVSSAVALENALRAEEDNFKTVSHWNTELRTALSAIPKIRINSPKNSIPYILNIGAIGIKGVEMQKMLDEKGFCVSVKSACSSDLLPSKIINALTHDKKRAFESFRISLSPLTKEEEVTSLIQALKEILENR